jgi:hypothetical protein
MCHLMSFGGFISLGWPQNKDAVQFLVIYPHHQTGLGSLNLIAGLVGFE